MVQDVLLSVACSSVVQWPSMFSLIWRIISLSSVTLLRCLLVALALKLPFPLLTVGALVFVVLAVDQVALIFVAFFVFLLYSHLVV